VVKVSGALANNSSFFFTTYHDLTLSKQQTSRAPPLLQLEPDQQAEVLFPSSQTLSERITAAALR